MVNTQGKESRGSGFETSCGVTINTLVEFNKLAGESPNLLYNIVAAILGLCFIDDCLVLNQNNPSPTHAILWMFSLACQS